MRIKALFVGLALLSFTPNLRAQQLNRVEKKLVESVDAHAADEIAALEKVVNTDSGTFNTTGVREVGRYFQQELESLGFKTRWISMPEAMHRAGHLIAEHAPEKSSGNRVLLIGHMDTVFEGQGHRFERSGDTVRGAGSMDMKGGDIALLYALKALQDAGMLNHAYVRVFLTGDEENPGSPIDVSRRDIIDAARQSDVALSFEPQLVRGKIRISRRGLSTWSLQTTGVQGHSAFVLRDGGDGAIYEASRVLDGFQMAFTGHPSITINPGLFLGGTDVAYDAQHSSGTSAGKFNVVARAATVKGDLRFLSETEREQAKSRMREIAAANLPKTSAQLSFDDLVPGWPVMDQNVDVMRMIDAVSRDLGQGPLEMADPVAGGFGDFNFIATVVKGADGLGVIGKGLHSPDETIDLKSLEPATARAAVLIARLLRRQPQQR